MKSLKCTSAFKPLVTAYVRLHCFAAVEKTVAALSFAASSAAAGRKQSQAA